MLTTRSVKNEEQLVLPPVFNLHSLAKFLQYQSIFSQFCVGVCCTECKVDNCQKCSPKDSNICLKCDAGYTDIGPFECIKGTVDISSRRYFSPGLLMSHASIAITSKGDTFRETPQILLILFKASITYDIADTLFY